MNRYSSKHALARTISALMLISAFILSPTSPGLAVSTLKSNSAVIPSGAVQPQAPLSAPTVFANPAHGYAHQQIVVSGQGLPGSTGVRLYWKYRTAAGLSTSTHTLSAGESALDATNHYALTVEIPLLDAVIPPVSVCAVQMNDAMAQPGCGVFQYEPQPPASLVGRLAVATPDAVLNLMDFDGSLLYTTQLGPDGSYNLSGVNPGFYFTSVTGNVSAPFDTGTIEVKPANIHQISSHAVPSSEYDPVTGTTFSCINDKIRITRLTADHSMRTGGNGSRSATFGSLQPFNFGTYISGVSLPVAFQAYFQSSGAVVDRVEFHVMKPGGSIQPVGAPAFYPYTAGLDVGTLPVGLSTLYVSAVVNNQRTCPLAWTINVIADPMKDPVIQPGTGQTTWDAGPESYHFTGKIPNFFNLLPLSWPNPPLNVPLLGKMENRLDAGLLVDGHLELDSTIHLHWLRAAVQLRAVSKDLYAQSEDFIGPGADVLGVYAGKQTYFPYGPEVLWRENPEWTLFDGPVASFFGFVFVSTSIRLGINGELDLAGKIYPLAPGVEASLDPYLALSLSNRWKVSVAFIASAYVQFLASAGIGLPLTVSTLDSRHVWLDNPCMRFYLEIKAWAEVGLCDISDDLCHKFGPQSKYPVDESYPSGCTSAQNSPASADRMAALPFDPPPLLSEPVIATSLGGQTLSLDVEDTDPGATQKFAIMARAWAANTGWSAPLAISDGTHYVSHPALAFYGLDGKALAAWVQNSMTLPQMHAELNLNTIVQHQEIYYALYDPNSGWGAPQRLTNDAVADGMPAMAGDVDGLTLAWDTDTGGVISNTLDVRVSVVNYNLDPASRAGSWGSIVQLGGSGMDGEVSVARGSARVCELCPYYPLGRVLAWTEDGDGKLATNSDRRLVVADWSGSDDNYTLTSPAILPAGAGAPTLAMIPPNGDVALAFLARGKEPDGATDTGVGTQMALWTAQRTAGTWDANPLMDNGSAVYGDEPKMAVNSDGEKLILFRRFGAFGTPAYLGQLALAQSPAGMSAYQPPLYLTEDWQIHWQPAVAVDPLSGQLHALDVALNDPANQPKAPRPALPSPAMPGMSLSQASTFGPGLEQFDLDAGPDLALDPALAVSQYHAPVDSGVTVSATLRNLGRGLASSPPGVPPIQVCFFSGTAPAGALLGCVPASPDALVFNDQQTVAFSLNRQAGDQPVYAQVSSMSANGSPKNDVASARLGMLPAPRLVGVAPDAQGEAALRLIWQPSGSAGVSEYRILRGAALTGPFELVGEASGPDHLDVRLQRGQTYCYALVAVGADGVWSAPSNAICAAAPLVKIFVPLIVR